VGRKGFTLLELLIAMTLLGFVLAMLVGGLRIGARVWETGEQAQDRLAQLQLVQRLVRRQLGRALPLRLVETQGERRIAFDGAAEALRFAGPAPAHLAAGGLYRLAIRASEGAEALRLVMTWRPFEDDAEAFAEDRAVELEDQDFDDRDFDDRDFDDRDFEAVILLDDIAGVDFAYFGALDEDEAPAWHEEWDGLAQLPALVRLRVDFADDDERVWPDLVVAPMISAAQQ
jgi:general secretion pathway protein J